MAAPLYRQMAGDLRQQIESGRLAPADLAGLENPRMSRLPPDGQAAVAEIARTAFDESGFPRPYRGGPSPGLEAVRRNRRVGDGPARAAGGGRS